MKLAESPTFGMGGGNVDVCVFRLAEDDDHDEGVPLQDVAF